MLKLSEACVNGDIIDGICECHAGWRGIRCNQEGGKSLLHTKMLLFVYLLPLFLFYNVTQLFHRMMQKDSLF